MTAIANPEMAAAWGGPEGEYWADNDEQFRRTARSHEDQLFGAAAIEPTDHVLDVGCGCGASTREAARRAPEGYALGLDLSPQMLERARRLAADCGLSNVEFVHGDAQVHPFGRARYDKAISVFGTMFFNDPAAAFANIAEAVRPRGQVTLLVWADLRRNDWVSTMLRTFLPGPDLPVPPPDASGPFSLADPDRVRGLLTGAGFTHIDLSEINDPMVFGSDAEDAYRFMTGLGIARHLVSELDEGDRATALQTFRDRLDERAGPEGVLFDSAAWLVTASKP